MRKFLVMVSCDGVDFFLKRWCSPATCLVKVARRAARACYTKCFGRRFTVFLVENGRSYRFDFMAVACAGSKLGVALREV